MSGSQHHLLVLNAAEGGIQLVLARLEPEKKDPLPQETQPPATIAAFKPVLLCSQWWSAPSQGAELLTPALENVLNCLGLAPRHISHIACVRGPGGFTGIRLALVSASGLANATGAIMGAVDYLPLLADQAAELTGYARPQAEDASFKKPSFWVVTHARRNLVHMQGFAPACEGGPFPRALTDILVLPPEQAVEVINAHHGATAAPAATSGPPLEPSVPPVEIPIPPVLLGSGLLRNKTAWSDLAPRLPEGTRLLPEPYNAPQPPALLRHALAASYSSRELEPLYVRPSDAEENLEHISSLLHIDPKAARKRLDALTRS